MSRRRRIQQGYYVNGKRTILCERCGREVIGVDDKTVSAVCSKCISRSIPIEKPITYIPTGRPAGWHWMVEFVDKDGNVFHKGKEVPELKGTLKPTKVKPRKKAKRKRQTKEQMLVARYKEKKSELKKAVQKQKDFLNHNIDKG
jgi:hypothetical protein